MVFRWQFGVKEARLIPEYISPQRFLQDQDGCIRGKLWKTPVANIFQCTISYIKDLYQGLNTYIHMYIILSRTVLWMFRWRRNLNIGTFRPDAEIEGQHLQLETVGDLRLAISGLKPPKNDSMLLCSNVAFNELVGYTQAGTVSGKGQEQREKIQRQEPRSKLRRGQRQNFGLQCSTKPKDIRRWLTCWLWTECLPL